MSAHFWCAWSIDSPLDCAWNDVRVPFPQKKKTLWCACSLLMCVVHWSASRSCLKWCLHPIPSKREPFGVCAHFWCAQSINLPLDHVWNDVCIPFPQKREPFGVCAHFRCAQSIDPPLDCVWNDVCIPFPQKRKPFDVCSLIYDVCCVECHSVGSNWCCWGNNPSHAWWEWDKNILDDNKNIS